MPEVPSYVCVLQCLQGSESGSGIQMRDRTRQGWRVDMGLSQKVVSVKAGYENSILITEHRLLTRDHRLQHPFDARRVAVTEPRSGRETS